MIAGYSIPLAFGIAIARRRLLRPLPRQPRRVAAPDRRAPLRVRGPMDDNEQTGEIGPIAAGRTRGVPDARSAAPDRRRGARRAPRRGRRRRVGRPRPRQRNPARRPDRGPGRGAARRRRLLGRRRPPEEPRRARARRADRPRASLSRFRAAAGASGAAGTGTTGTTGTTGAERRRRLRRSARRRAATGTISVVDGNTLYVLTTTGSLVKVTLGPSTTITRNAKSTADRPAAGRHRRRPGSDGDKRQRQRLLGLGDRARRQLGRRFRRRRPPGRTRRLRLGGDDQWLSFAADLASHDC